MRERPSDVSLIDWANRDDFARSRAEWQELIRRDPGLLPVTKIVLWEISSRMGFDRNSAWPSAQLIGAELDISERTVKRSVAESVERGWLICEKRGFGGSNHYAMSVSRSVLNAVEEAREGRMANFKDTRRQSIGTSVSPLKALANRDICVPSIGTSASPHSGHPCPLNRDTGVPLSLSKNPITEPLHRSLPKIPSNGTEQDIALGRSFSRTDLDLVLGEGNEWVGAARASLLGIERVRKLLAHIRSDGVVGAAEEIQDAIAVAVAAEAEPGAARVVVPS